MINVLIVDDSATARSLIKSVLESDRDINVVGAAPDAYIARDMIVKLNPDVVCLDVEMPRMDGITFLKKLMQHMPKPVIMVSSLTRSGAKTTLDALESGAIDFVAKPHSNIYDGIDDIKEELVEKVKSAAKVNVKKLTLSSKPLNSKPLSYLSETTNKIIAIGASTGGTEALKEVITKMPRNCPGIIIVQHMPPKFTKSFAERLNQLSQIEVVEARNRESVTNGKAILAPGSYHMVLRRVGAKYHVEIGDGKKVSGHKPSVDVMFNSVAKVAGANAIGVIMTGMGADGAKGLLNMKKTGSPTIGQDEKTSVVYGMPKVAYNLGAVDTQAKLEDIAGEILNVAKKIKS